MDSARNKYLIAAIAFVLIAIAVYFLFIFQKGDQGISKKPEPGEQKEVTEIDIADRPFVTITPTSDGAEIIISIENMGKFDAIEYELTYLADNPQSPGTKITRGATGTDVNTQDAKYKKSVLLGTASRGVRSPDTGITDGKLVMHMFIGEEEFLSETDWTLEKIGASATLKSQDGNFEIEIPSFGRDYWLIIANTLGVPPNPQDFTLEEVVLPVYGTFSIAPAFKGTGTVSIKVENQTTTPTLFAYNHNEATYSELESTFNSGTSTLVADIANFATFVVVSGE